MGLAGPIIPGRQKGALKYPYICIPPFFLVNVSYWEVISLACLEGGFFLNSGS